MFSSKIGINDQMSKRCNLVLLILVVIILFSLICVLILIFQTLMNVLADLVRMEGCAEMVSTNTHVNVHLDLLEQSVKQVRTIHGHLINITSNLTPMNEFCTWLSLERSPIWKLDVFCYCLQQHHNSYNYFKCAVYM